MTKLEQAARQALGALEVATTPLAKDRQEVLRAITTLREALSGVQALSAAPAEQEEAAQRLRKTLDIDPGDVNDPLHPRYIAGFKSGHAAGRRRAAPAASPTPPAEQQVIIDFAQVGTAGPFHVVNGRVKLPDATMQDLARMLRPTYEAEQAAPKAAAAKAADSAPEDAGGANWQDISTAPKDGTRFVAVGNNYGLYSETEHVCIAQWFRGCWMEASDWNETSELRYLTHWMPLPPLPGNAARKQGGA